MSEISKRLLTSILLLPTILFIIIKGSIIFNLFVLICLLITIYEWHLMSSKKPYLLIGYAYILISFYTFFKLRNDFDLSLMMMIIMICICTDIGGYIFGKFFKGPKLIKFSPKKTYTGMIGSFLLPIFFLLIIDNLGLSFISLNLFNPTILFFTLIVSAVSQFGDIFISYFKRLAKIKDTGKIIPGHGGILDRIDGMIFVFPVSYFLLKNNFFHVL